MGCPLAMIVSCSCLLIAAPLVSAVERTNIYYLAVGSAHYSLDNGNPWHLRKIEAASRGAQRVAGLLDSHGAKFGITLLSASEKHQTEGVNHYLGPQMVSKKDITTALENLLTRVEEEGTDRSIVVVYVASHGLAKGSAFGHYTVPGDINFVRNPITLPRRWSINKLLYAGEVVRKLRNRNVPYILLLDSCYENSAEWYKRSYAAERRFFAAGPEEWDKFVASQIEVEKFADDYPVVFATSAGNIVFSVPDSRDESSTTSIAPIARRLTLFFDAIDKEFASATFGDLLDAIVSTDLDLLSEPPVIYSTRINQLDEYVLLYRQPTGERIERTGSATETVDCCSPSDGP